MIPLPDLLTFALAGLVLNLTPGQDVMFATASGVAGGPRAGAAAGVGVALGCMLHVALAAAGLAALIAAHPAALDAIRWGGAAYLLWLAWKSWTASGLPDTGRGAMTARAALGRGPVAAQILILGSVFSLTGMAVTAGFGYAAGVASRRIGARLAVLNKVAAVVFAGLAARLLWAR